VSGTADLGFRAGVDIGGTFTDIVLVGPDGRLATRKISSSTDDYSRGILQGLHELLAQEGLQGASIAEVVHGTTVATNAILEYKGAKTALLTTRGFRDVLELRRIRVPELYNPRYVPPRPLVERYLRLEVDERIGADGEIIRPLDEASVHAAVERLRRHGVEAIAVCLLHSYKNPVHERRVGEIVRSELGNAFLSLSVDVLPEFREYERTSTTVINAYVGPMVRTYLGSLAQQLAASGIIAPVLLMQSNGGAMSAEAAAEMPARILESGPAAGVIAAQRLSQRTGLLDLITFDMGGTTAKAAMIQRGRLMETTDYEIGAGISLSSRLTKGGGHALRLPVLDIAEVGAGGGSIVWIDRGGALKVGPHSAGAVPGPACYGVGDEPTVTDASVVLGYVNPHAIAGGAIRLIPDRSKQALERKVAEPLGMELLDAAYGVTTVAIANMVRAVKAVSTYVGRDPREFVMLAFGGSGPMFAAAMARSLEMKRVVVPPAAGLFSSFGLLEADLEQHFARSFFGVTTEIDLAALNRTFDQLESQARDTLRRHHGGDGEVIGQRAIDMHYTGQTSELTMAVPSRTLRGSDLLDFVELFGQEHERTYGHRGSKEPVEIVNVRVTARIGRPRAELQAWRASGSSSEIPSREPRSAYFGPDYGLIRTPVLGRLDLVGPRPGPVIIDEYDSTTVVPPGCTAELDKEGNILINVA
jgi:N-methylhydantoinase A